MICCSASGVGRVVGIEKDLNNNEYVLVEIERPFYDVPNKQRFDIIPLFDWKDSCKRFSKFIDKGDIIAFKGRIETRCEIGLSVVCEQLSVILKQKEKTIV